VTIIELERQSRHLPGPFQRIRFQCCIDGEYVTLPISVDISNVECFHCGRVMNYEIQPAGRTVFDEIMQDSR
jgi:hypothetical protein